MTHSRTTAPLLGLATLGLLTLTAPAARADVTINGTDTGQTSVTISSTTYPGGVTSAVANAPGDSVTVDNGGTVNNNAGSFNDFGVTGYAGTLTLGDTATVSASNGTGNYAVDAYAKNGSLTVSVTGGQYTAAGGTNNGAGGTESIGLYLGANLGTVSATVTGGQFSASGSFYNYAAEVFTGTLTDTGGQFTATGGSNPQGLNIFGGTTTITGGTITAIGDSTSGTTAPEGIASFAGTVNLNGGTVSASGGANGNYGIVTFDSATVNVSGGQISAGTAASDEDLQSYGGIINLYGQFYTDGTYQTLYTGPSSLTGSGTVYAELADNGGAQQALSYNVAAADLGQIVLHNEPVASAAPEPSGVGMLALLGLGLGGLVLRARRNSRTA